MVRQEDFEELAQVLDWGETADSYVLMLDDVLSGRRQEPEVIEKQTDAAVRLLDDLSKAKEKALSPSFDRLSVYAFASSLTETRGRDALDFDGLMKELKSANLGEVDELSKLQACFERIAEAMHRAAFDLANRGPSWQF